MYARQTGAPGEVAVVVLQREGAEEALAIYLPTALGLEAGTPFTDRLSGEQFAAEGGLLLVSMRPWSARVLVP